MIGCLLDSRIDRPFPPVISLEDHVFSETY